VFKYIFFILFLQLITSAIIAQEQPRAPGCVFLENGSERCIREESISYYQNWPSFQHFHHFGYRDTFVRPAGLIHEG